MIDGFDHVILGVNVLEQAVHAFENAGFSVVARPDAQRTDTENRFVCFENGSYLQLAQLHDPQGAHKWAQLIGEGDGWVDLAMRTSDADGLHERLHAAGITVTEPRTSVRPLTDGREWSIKVMHAGRGAGQTPALPYFVEDRSDRAIRVPPPAAMQPGGAGVTGVTILVEHLDTRLPAIERVYGKSEPMQARFEGASAARLVRSGAWWVEIIEPASGSNPLRDHLARRGEGVFEASLGLAAPSNQARVLTVSGARIAINDQ